MRDNPMKKYYKYILVSLGLVISIVAHSELKAINDTDLSGVSAQSGITLSGQLELKNGTHFSYLNKDAETTETQENWLVLHNIHGAIEFKKAKLDLQQSYGSSNKSAVQITLPESMEFKQFKVEGLYLGPGQAKSNSHRYLLGVDINGTLRFPTQAKAHIFVK